MKEIHLHIGNWRWVVFTGILCTTLVVLSKLWIPYLQDRDHVQLVMQTSELMEKHVPAGLKHAMGGLEYPIKKKVKVVDE